MRIVSHEQAIEEVRGEGGGEWGGVWFREEKKFYCSSLFVEVLVALLSRCTLLIVK